MQAAVFSDTAPASAAGRRKQSGPAAVGARKVAAPSCRGWPGPGHVPTAEPPRCPRRRPAGAFPRDPPHLGPEQRPSPAAPGTAPGPPGAAPGLPVTSRCQPGPGRLPAAAGIGSDGQTASVPGALKTVRNLGWQSPGRAGEPGRCHRGERRLEEPLAPPHPVGGLALQCWSVPGALVERAALSVLPRIAKRCPRVEKDARGIAAKTKVTCRVILLSLWEVLRKAELPFTAHH